MSLLRLKFALLVLLLLAFGATWGADCASLFTLPPQTLTFSPLGGTRRIGSNMLHFKMDGEEFLIDAGASFARGQDVLGIDLFLPDISPVQNPQAVYITHAHEDHIGGLLRLVERFPKINIYASEFTAAVIRQKLGTPYRSLVQEFSAEDYQQGIKIGSGTLYPMTINHSIPGSLGFLILHPLTSRALFYVSDFRIDDTGYTGEVFDLSKLKERTQYFRHRLLMADATNNLTEGGFTPREKDVVDSLRKLMQNQQRIFVTFFASNVFRMRTLLILAKEMGYQVLPYGRSMDTYLNLGQKYGFLGPELVELITRGMKNGEYEYNPKQLVLVAGPQGEERAALYRIAAGKSPFTLKEGDTFIFSSKAIPGNEYQISKVMGMLAEQGVKIWHAKDAQIHASGHGSAIDWRILVDNFNPELVIPIHGESWQLTRHVDWVRENYPDRNTLLMHNADQVHWTPEGEFLLAHGQEPPAVPVNFKGQMIDPTWLTERQTLVRGVAVISIDTDAFMRDPLAPKKGKASYRTCRVICTVKGLKKLTMEEESNLVKEIQNFVQGIGQDNDKQQVVPLIRKYLRQKVKIRPALIIHYNGELLESGWATSEESPPEEE
ncbi:MAG: ribonuclease J [Bacteriovoracaceae bacterium]|nr:ribonuclease J [Bacteriovoracaceae bacterium]